jgi:pilus assembly protein Flp/PilA
MAWRIIAELPARGQWMSWRKGGEQMFLRMYTGLQSWWGSLRERTREEEGATAVEYALMVALIAAVIILAVTFIGTEAESKFYEVGSAVEGA